VTKNRTHRNSWGKSLLWACIFFAAAFILGPGPIQAQQSNTDPVTPGYSIPTGEKLVFSLDWDPPWYLFFFPNMHAGDAELQIAGETEFKGHKALKIIFKVRSSGMLSRLSGMKIEDEFVFLTDPETLCTLNVSKKVREGKRKRQIDVEYLQDTRQLHIVEYDESVNPPVLKKDSLKDDIPPCVQDPLSALYSLRKKTFHSDFEYTSVIGHDDVVKEIQSHVEKLEALDTTAGKIQAWRIRTVALMGGLFKKGGQFKIWLSAYDRKVPLQFEVKVSLGRVLGKLKESGIRESAE
jgi:hypothetical protein